MAEAAARRKTDSITRVKDALAARFGNKLVTSDAVRAQHANNTTWLPNEPPDGSVEPHCGYEMS